MLNVGTHEIMQLHALAVIVTKCAHTSTPLLPVADVTVMHALGPLVI